MTQLIISGNVDEVERIIRSLRERYGNLTINELCEKFSKEVLILK